MGPGELHEGCLAAIAPRGWVHEGLGALPVICKCGERASAGHRHPIVHPCVMLNQCSNPHRPVHVHPGAALCAPCDAFAGTNCHAC